MSWKVKMLGLLAVVVQTTAAASLAIAQSLPNVTNLEPDGNGTWTAFCNDGTQQFRLALDTISQHPEQVCSVMFPKTFKLLVNGPLKSGFVAGDEYLAIGASGVATKVSGVVRQTPTAAFDGFTPEEGVIDDGVAVVVATKPNPPVPNTSSTSQVAIFTSQDFGASWHQTFYLAAHGFPLSSNGQIFSFFHRTGTELGFFLLEDGGRAKWYFSSDSGLSWAESQLQSPCGLKNKVIDGDLYAVCDGGIFRRGADGQFAEWIPYHGSGTTRATSSVIADFELIDDKAYLLTTDFIPGTGPSSMSIFVSGVQVLDRATLTLVGRGPGSTPPTGNDYQVQIGRFGAFPFVVQDTFLSGSWPSGFEELILTRDFDLRNSDRSRSVLMPSFSDYAPTLRVESYDQATRRLLLICRQADESRVYVAASSGLWISE